MKKLLSIVKDEEGAAVAEYSVLVALIAMGILLAVTNLLGISLNEIFNHKAG